LKRKRVLYLRSAPEKILDLYRHVIELCAKSHDEGLEEHLHLVMTSPDALDMLRGLVPNGLDLINSRLVDPLLEMHHTDSIRWLQLLVSYMMHDQDSNGILSLHISES
jgi:hypothetical protein